MADFNILEEESPIVQPSSDERIFAILCHILTLFTSIIAPLIIYLLKKDESEYVSEHAKESLNFQITLAIISIILTITLIGVLLLWVVYLIDVIFVIIATIKASDNKIYRYPLTIRLIK